MWYFDDVQVGYEEESPPIPADEDEMIAYAAANDPFPIHTDRDFARRSPYGGVIASWGYTVSLFFRAVHTMTINRELRQAFIGGLEWRVRFVGPVRPGTIRVRCTVLDTRRAASGDRGVVTSRNDVVDDDGNVCVSVEVVSLIAARPTPS